MLWCNPTKVSGELFPKEEYQTPEQKDFQSDQLIVNWYAKYVDIKAFPWFFSHTALEDSLGTVASAHMIL